MFTARVPTEGTSLRGEPFTREELRTIAVWTRGDERPSRPDGRGLDLCGLLSCLLEDDALGKIAREREIDVERLRQCMKHHCQ